MRQLLWKEWREQAWKLAFASIVLSAMAAIGLRARMVPDATLVDWVCLLGVTLVPVLAATGLVPAERAEGTLEFLLSLPVPPGRVLWAKGLAGALQCVAPLATAAAVSLAIAGGRETYASAMLGLYGRSMLAGLALYGWMVALTIRLPSETRAALIAVGVLLIWVLASAGLMQPSLRHLAFATSPYAFEWPLTNVSDGPELGTVLVVQSVLSVGVWWAAARAFARPEV